MPECDGPEDREEEWVKVESERSDNECFCVCGCGGENVWAVRTGWCEGEDDKDEYPGRSWSMALKGAIGCDRISCEWIGDRGENERV